jgi:cytochrome c-type protein NapB
MNRPGIRPGAVAIAVLLIALAATAMVALVVAIQRAPLAHTIRPSFARAALLSASDPPIADEAQVFQTGSAMLAIEPAGARYRTAHPRTLTTFRFLRAYPGAPPWIPHPLSPEEFRTGRCTSCHERGGYSWRFAAYAPVTPHPDAGVCLQCHVGVDGAMGLGSGESDPNLRCPICHGPNGGSPRPDVSLTWSTTVWPALPRMTRDQNPPPIPHDLQLRGNCLACHSGPAAVAEIRTSHPERTNCRQCHVALDPGAELFTRSTQEMVIAREGAE